MDNNTITCPNCGATCKAKDEYCKSCWKRLNTETELDNSVTEGMSQSEWVDWELFIDKNADRYIETYKKNENKKIFAHMNWSAFFFGLNWVLYRKMTKVAVISFVIMCLISVLLLTAFLLPYRAEIKSLNESTDPYDSFKIVKITAKAQLFSLLIIPLTCVFWGLFGDSIYKMHIEKNIKRNNGGTSIAELLGGRIVLGVINLLLLSPLTYLVIGILT